MTRRFWLVGVLVLIAVAACIYAPNIILAQQNSESNGVKHLVTVSHCQSADYRQPSHQWNTKLGVSDCRTTVSGEEQKAGEFPDMRGNGPDDVRTKWGLWLAYKTLTDPIALFTFGLTLGTVALAVFTVGLVREARREFIASHGPKIRIRSIRGLLPTDRDDSFDIEMVMENIGEGQAVITRVDVESLILSKGREELEIDGRSNGGRSGDITLAPGVDATERYTMTRNLGLANLSQDRILAVTGAIIYDDRLRTQRTTRFYREFMTVSRLFVSPASDNPRASEDYES